MEKLQSSKIGLQLDSLSIAHEQLQSILKQHRFELWGSTYTWTFFKKYYSATWTVIGWTEDTEGQWFLKEMHRHLTARSVSSPNPVLFKGQLYFQKEQTQGVLFATFLSPD